MRFLSGSVTEARMKAGKHRQRNEKRETTEARGSAPRRSALSTMPKLRFGRGSRDSSSFQKVLLFGSLLLDFRLSDPRLNHHLNGFHFRKRVQKYCFFFICANFLVIFFKKKCKMSNKFASFRNFLYLCTHFLIN